MKDLICIENFESDMEANLMKNALEEAGIPSVVVLQEEGAKTHYGVFVNSGDRERALEALREEAAPQGGSDQPQEVFDQEAARREFDEIRLEDRKAKAASAKSAGIAAILLAAAAAAVFFLVPNRSIGWRAAFGCLFLAAVEFFVWRDGLNAQKQLRGEGHEKD